MTPRRRRSVSESENGAKEKKEREKESPKIEKKKEDTPHRILDGHDVSQMVWQGCSIIKPNTIYAQAYACKPLHSLLVLLLGGHLSANFGR